jgi:hypothetical protein
MPLKRALKVRFGHSDLNAPAKRKLSFAGRSLLRQGASATGAMQREDRLVVCAFKRKGRYATSCFRISRSFNSVDYTTLITLLPPSSDQVVEAKRSLRLLEPRIEEAQKREMGEMVDKLKGLGNSVLGK